MAGKAGRAAGWLAAGALATLVVEYLLVVELVRRRL